MYILPNLFSYTMIGQSLCFGFMVVETILAPLYKESPADSLQNCSAVLQCLVIRAEREVEELETGEG